MYRRLGKSCPLLLSALLLAVLLPVMPASAAARAESRTRLLSRPHPLSVRTLDADDDFAGAVPLTTSPVNGTLTYGEPGDPGADVDDIYSLTLQAGQTLTVQLQGPPGDVWFDAWLWKSPDWDSFPAAASDGMSEEGAWTYPQTLTFTAGTSGVYYLDIYDNWGSGAYSFTWAVTGPRNESTGQTIDMKRLAGPNRYATALAVSQAAYASGATANVILATGANFADALAASALAGSYDAPILLTYPTSVAPGIHEEIDRLRGSQAATVMIVGSNKAVSDGVAQALAGFGGISVKRFAGPDRYATAVAIGNEVYRHETAELGHPWSGFVLVARGDTYPDALAAAPVAFKRKMPILLVTPTAIPAATAAGMSSVHASHSYVLGSSIAVSQYVASHLGVPATRIEGAPGSGRLGTAVALADYVITQHPDWGVSASSVGIATGWNFPDALGGGAMIGKEGGIMLLTRPTDAVLSDIPWYFIRSQQTHVTRMRAFGSNITDGEGIPLVVGDEVFPDFLDALKPPL